MKQVLIRPLWENGLNNKLFETIYPWSLTLWREAAAKLGIALDGWDTMPLNRADCVWLLDLPRKKKVLDEARRQARSGIPFVLQVMESPLGNEHNFMESNQALCDYVVTYRQDTNGNPNHFSYRLPIVLERNRNPVPFAQRRPIIMVNTNRVSGFLAMRQPGLAGLPGIGRCFNGWDKPWWSCYNPARGELYSWRRKFARTVEAVDPGLLTLIGRGWGGERVTWCPQFSKRAYRCCKESHHPDKLKVVAGHRFCISVENYRGTCDYVSEKLFDAWVAGSVPVYLGDENISKLVPGKAFVDVRNFRTHRELIQYLQSCPEAEWEEMYRSGQEFLKTEAAREFSTESFVRNMNGILVKILGLSPGGDGGSARQELRLV